MSKSNLNEAAFNKRLDSIQEKKKELEALLAESNTLLGKNLN